MSRRADLFAPTAATLNVGTSTSDERDKPASGGAWSVGALCRAVGESLQARFGLLSVRGEISGLSPAASGHLYFTLKDEAGQMRCAMFRRAAHTLGFVPREGDQVEVRARVAVYEQRGDLQLIVEGMQRSGQGALFEDFLRLKARLEARGLFAPERKRALPSMPRGIGLVTSLGAAALRDVATAWARRAPHIPIVLAAAAVQGAGAATELIAALHKLYAIAAPKADAAQPFVQTPPSSPPIDLIVIVRGGGSLQDLWSFNDEALAQTIAAAPVPIVTGIGHETDFTIADFCADLRAPTPTAAAELTAPARAECLTELAGQQSRLHRAAARAIERQWQRLDLAALRLKAPAQQLQQRREQLASIAHRIQRSAAATLAQQRQAHGWAARRLAHMPVHSLQTQRHTLAQLRTRIELLAPAHLMQRGWAMLTTPDGHTVISTISAAPVGAPLKVHLADGVLDVTVTQPKLI